MLELDDGQLPPPLMEAQEHEERVILGEPTDRTALRVEELRRRQYERWMGPENPEAEAGGKEVRDGEDAVE